MSSLLKTMWWVAKIAYSRQRTMTMAHMIRSTRLWPMTMYRQQ